MSRIAEILPALTAFANRVNVYRLPTGQVSLGLEYDNFGPFARHIYITLFKIEVAIEL